MGILGILAFFFLTRSGSIPEWPTPSFQAKDDLRKAPRENKVLSSEKMAGLLDEQTVPEESHSSDKQIIIDTLHELFAVRMDHPRVQVEAIEQLIRLLKKLYPDDWESHVLEYLTAAFPDYAESLYENYKKLSLYSTWAQDNRQMLSDLPLYQIHDRIWEKRIEIFGDEALAIWEMELKKEDVKHLVADILSQEDMAFNEKADYYNQHLNDIYGDMAGAFKKIHQQELINKFLDIETVQVDLQAMTDKERKEQLTGLRKTMGLDEDALKRWDDLDGERNERWDKGLAYMKAREQLLKSLDGDDPEDALDKLRTDYFGADAETIKREEQSGLYRFNRKRMYGKN